jgi:hypothetical protein
MDGNIAFVRGAEFIKQGRLTGWGHWLGGDPERECSRKML